MNYETLQSVILDWMNRPDLTAQVSSFIADGEARLNRDVRVKEISARTDIQVDADGLVLPADLRRVESWYHDGPTIFGPMASVNPGQLGTAKAHRGAQGVPRVFAIVDDKAFFAPEPNAAFATRLVYFRRIPPLSDTMTTNWFLDDHPDIYRLAALVEASSFMEEDERVPLWASLLDERLNALQASTDSDRFSGNLVRRPDQAIGG